MPIRSMDISDNSPAQSNFLYVNTSEEGNRINTIFGKLINSQLEGPATVRCSNGTLLQGIFKEGKFIKGKITCSNGSYLDGTFENEYLIKGTKVDVHGVIWKGIFSQGSLVEGYTVSPKGSKKIGLFNNNKIIRGSIITSKGIHLNGEFSKETLVTGFKIRPNGNIFDYTNRQVTRIFTDKKLKNWIIANDNIMMNRWNEL